jgi:hypothetical protein
MHPCAINRRDTVDRRLWSPSRLRADSERSRSFDPKPQPGTHVGAMTPARSGAE